MSFGAGEERPPSRFRLRRLRFLLVAIVIVLIVFTLGGQLVWVWLNVVEFGDIYIRPIYFEILGGLVLASIALVRVDIKNRRSITWWLIRLLFGLIRYRTFGELPPGYVDFKVSKITPVKFVLWQATKVLVGMLVFGNVIFGMAFQATFSGWSPGLDKIWSIFTLPFVTPPLDPQYGQATVVPLIPSLTLLIPPLIGSIELRLIILLGATQLLRIITPTAGEFAGETAFRLGWRVAAVEALAGIGLLWTGFKLFFPSNIDYNTRYLIGALFASGILLLAFSILDRTRMRGLLPATRRPFALRLLALVIIGLIAGSVVALNNSAADARKLDYLGPYVVQQVGVNRFLADLDKVKEVPYDVRIAPTTAGQINSYVQQHEDLLQKVRLWDSEASFAKLKPEIGLLPYIDFEDLDILRFNGTLYWSASLKPVLPSSVRPEDAWYSEHLSYTNVPSGFLLLDAQDGRVTDSAQFFKQRQIYYGEGGLYRDVWAAYPVGRDTSAEVGGLFYNGKGGVNVPPPLSWIFEFNFLLGFRDQTVHVLRYRDVFARMKLLFPYFEYDVVGEKGLVDMFPVTDGARTYWLMPLVVSLETEHVPWSVGNQFKRLVGYALIDIYNGSIQIITVGDDYFSKLFKTVYGDVVTSEIPAWLKNQLRYPEELFEWRIGMYNLYHVVKPDTFINAREFFEVPEGLDTYYVMSKPPGFEKPEFVGLLSLELRGAGGKNLAGYMVVRNDYPNLGQMIFYQVPLASETKLLGPTAVLQALDRNSQFAQLRTLLRQPRIGNNILYRVGDHDVYFIPVYTAGTAGVVTQLGTVAAVGAAFQGDYYVGLGSTPTEAFRAYLAELSGVAAPPTVGKEQRLDNLTKLFEQQGLEIARPTAINPDVTFNEGNATYITEDQRPDAQALINSFIQKWVKPYDVKTVLLWTNNEKVNFGVLLNINGIVELRYITISLE